MLGVSPKKTPCSDICYIMCGQLGLATGLDDKLWETQYGFRKKRSTAQPLFITRRLQDLAEASGDKLFLVSLDWEKAFDKVDQENLSKQCKD